MDKSKKADSTPPSKQSKVCNYCHEKQKLTEYYISKNPIHSADGRVPICKSCIFKESLNEDGTINFIGLSKILKAIDRPYYKDSIDIAMESLRKTYPFIEAEKIPFYGKEILSKYFTLIAMKHDVHKTYADSENDGFIHHNDSISKKKRDEIQKKYEDLQGFHDTGTKDRELQKINNKRHIASAEGFEVTDDMRELFGDNFTTIEYKKMHEKYEKLKLNYTLQTNLHQEALATYVRFKVKEEIATANGNVDEAKKWYDAAQNAADKAKLTPKQLTQADLHGGINSFSEIFKAVEQAVDVIPILPTFKYRPNDACDFIIWCYINYARDLQGLPQCKYEDVYKFYDKKKKEYISQYGDPYGIFDDDPTEEIRPNIKKFITIPKEFEEDSV